MSLFNLIDICSTNGSEKSPVVEFDEMDIAFSPGEKTAAILPLVRNMKENSSIYFMTDGAWSNIDIVSVLISITGPCSIDFCTWSISTDAIRKFTQWQEKGLITSLHVLLDQGIRNRKPEIYQQAISAFKNLQLLKCHAKVAVMHNENFYFVIVGSANFTNNPRKEAGLIIRSKNIADANISWIRKEFLNG